MSMGARMMWSWGRSASGVESKSGKRMLGHLGEVLVAQAAEDEGAGLDSGRAGDGGAEGPGAGGVVGDVEQDGLGREEFEAAGPAGVARCPLRWRVAYVVTYLVTIAVLVWIVT